MGIAFSKQCYTSIKRKQYSTSILYRNLEHLEGITIIRIPLTRGESKEVHDSLIENTNIHPSEWHYMNDHLLLAIGVRVHIIVKDKYNNGYRISCTTNSPYDSLKLVDYILYNIQKEEIIDALLLNYRHLYDSRVYSICKFYIFDNTSKDVDPNIDIVYSGNLLMKKEDIAAHIVPGSITTGDIKIYLSVLNIALAILGKADRREYNNPKMYEGMNISPVKNAKFS